MKRYLISLLAYKSDQQTQGWSVRNNTHLAHVPMLVEAHSEDEARGIGYRMLQRAAPNCTHHVQVREVSLELLTHNDQVESVVPNGMFNNN